MPGRRLEAEDVQFRFGNVVATNGARLVVALVVLGVMAVGGAAGSEASELLVEPSSSGASADDGP